MRLRQQFLACSMVALTMSGSATLAADVSIDIQESVHGTFSLFSLETEGASPTAAAAEASALGGSVLWHRHFDNPIYTSTGIVGPAGVAVAGTWLNPPMQVETVPLVGSGTENWTHAGTEFFVAASRDGSVLAAVDFVREDSTATISAFNVGSSTPLWSYVVHPCRPAVYAGWASRKPIRVSDDGSKIAAAIIMHDGGSLRGRLLAFDSGSGVPTVNYDFPETGSPIATEMSTDGKFVTVAAWPNIYVYDCDANSLRWSGPIGSGNDALAISNDGEYIAWGWTRFHLMSWNGSTYVSEWSYDPPGTVYVGQCALAPDGSSLAIVWDNGSTTPNETTVALYELPSLSLLWDYDYQAATARDTKPTGGLTDIPTSMRYAANGDRFVVGAWGGTFPEVHVFDRNGSDPLFTLDTPGSVFDVDIVTEVDGTSFVSVCGKAVHAQMSGRGGDFYSIEIPGSTTDVDSPTAAVAFGGLSVFPNPTGSGTTITYSLATTDRISLGVYDAAGRHVRSLFEGYGRNGEHSVLWDGRDEHGELLPPGIYFAEIVTGSGSDTQKLVLVR